MKTFLEETAEDIIACYGDNLEKIRIVLPNKRTGYFFQNVLAKNINETVWSPDIYTIQKYIAGISRIQKADKTGLIFLLYKSFKAVDEKFSMEFDAFFALGELILNDFNEVDSYLVDVEQIFTNIKNLHEIDQKYSYLTEEQIAIIRQYWMNFSPDEMSKEKEKFILLWNILPEVYYHFTDNLLRSNIAYEGLIYRKLTELIEEDNFPLDDKIVLFVGFNALNTAQKKIFKYLKNIGKAEFYWDTDSYYHLNKIQEAGDFLRVNFDVLDEPKDKIRHNFTAAGKKINLFGVPGNVAQAKVINHILRKHNEWEKIKQNPEKTVIVLTDESMLFPVLHSLPDEIPIFNITMGFPLKNSGLYSLIMYFLRIQQSIKRRESGKLAFYFKDVIAFLNHPFIYPAYQESAKEIIGILKNEQINYVSQSLLLKYKEELYDLVFTPVSEDKKAGGILTRLLNILFIVFNKLPKEGKKGSAEEEFIYHTYMSIKRLREVIDKYAGDIELTQELTVQILKQVLRGIRVPFESRSTDGMQIMGLIETRNIDFENVVLLNANEGILPNLNRAPSLISESMRHAFGMPVLKYQDAIFGYFFYRLMQRAKNINIIYNNLSGTSGTGELSRYVQQLREESNIEFYEFQLAQQLETSVRREIVIEKDEKIKQELTKYFKIVSHPKMFSSSAIEVYMSCPLRFYFRYIANIKEPETIDEEFSPIALGQIVHSVMEQIYKYLIETRKRLLVTQEDIKSVYPEVEKFVEEAFVKYYEKSDHQSFEFTGNLLVIKEVIIKYVKTILKVDEQLAPFDIVQLEENYAFKTEIKINVKGEEKTVVLSGIIDRIDKKDGIYRIIDYKTGSADKDFFSYDDLFAEELKKRKKAVFQLFVYGLLFKSQKKFSGKAVIPGIYDLRSMNKKDFSPEIYKKIGRGKTEPVNPDNFKEHLDVFSEMLSEKLSEIFDTEKPFIQTEIPDNCTYCPYKDICSVEA